MSATMDRQWLATVDFKPRVDELSEVNLRDEDRENPQVQQRWNAKKSLEKADMRMGNATGLASEILEKHKPATRTIVVVNTVHRACELFDALNRLTGGGKGRAGGKKSSLSQSAMPYCPKVVLIHSRFRPADRKARVLELLCDPPPEGIICVSTQVVEAGVDVSARALFTELAPWASLVQRFGRCNRRGEYKDAYVCWIDLPAAAYEGARMTLPYQSEQLDKA